MHTKASIHALLDANEKAVIRALYCIHGRQTASEQAGAMTKETNGVGFSKYDAPLLTDYVRQHRESGYLSKRQIVVARNKIKRYWRQLVEVANERIAATQPQAVDAQAVAAEPAAPIIESVSSDQLWRYKRLGGDPRCLCENFDGERKCDWCEERQFDTLIQLAEREEEERRMAQKFGSF
jgi:hypothetical protein